MAVRSIQARFAFTGDEVPKLVSGAGHDGLAMSELTKVYHHHGFGTGSCSPAVHAMFATDFKAFSIGFSWF